MKTALDVQELRRCSQTSWEAGGKIVDRNAPSTGHGVNGTLFFGSLLGSSLPGRSGLLGKTMLAGDWADMYRN